MDSSFGEMHTSPDADDFTTTEVVTITESKESVEDQTGDLVKGKSIQDSGESIGGGVDDRLGIHNTSDQSNDVEESGKALEHCHEVRLRELVHGNNSLHQGHVVQDWVTEAEVESFAVANTSSELSRSAASREVLEKYRLPSGVAA